MRRRPRELRTSGIAEGIILHARTLGEHRQRHLEIVDSDGCALSKARDRISTPSKFQLGFFPRQPVGESLLSSKA